MAKKQETKPVTVKETVVEEKTMEIATDFVEVKIPETKKDTWEIKDRVYYLKGRKKPLSYMLKATSLYYFDEELGYERELKHTQNQKTSFVDDMKGDQRLDHIIFRSGALHVPRNKQTLQKLLSLYHPHRDKVYYEWKPAEIARNEMEYLEMETDALIAARNLDIDMAEAVMRVEIGSRVSKMSSSELKRDLTLFARSNPEVFLELVADENVMLRNFGIKATEMGIIKLSSDQRNFVWGSNNRSLMTVPYEEHPYSALASWFKTDEGMEIYSNIEKRLKN